MTNGYNQPIAAGKIFHFVFPVPGRTLFSGFSGDRQELGEREVTASNEPTGIRAGAFNVGP
jgi:hypothetical protein